MLRLDRGKAQTLRKVVGKMGLSELKRTWRCEPVRHFRKKEERVRHGPNHSIFSGQEIRIDGI
jgi:hypothetical protein